VGTLYPGLTMGTAVAMFGALGTAQCGGVLFYFVID
jgi:hypothetical protein